MAKQAEIPKNKTLVSDIALAEIRVDICNALEAVASLGIEADYENRAANAIMPIAARLKSICEENDFPD